MIQKERKKIREKDRDACYIERRRKRQTDGEKPKQIDKKLTEQNERAEQDNRKEREKEMKRNERSTEKE